MKTLVIHATDPTTEFLRVIYKDTDWTVVNDYVGTRVMRNLIREHDRIVMLGHGCNKGLFGHDRLMIDASLVQFLRDKECVGIWCHAEEFFRKYKLKGFCTGMFVSDYMEANMYCVNSTYEEIEASNVRFAEIVEVIIFCNNYHYHIKDQYKPIDAVTTFNNNSLYYFPEGKTNYIMFKHVKDAQGKTGFSVNWYNDSGELRGQHFNTDFDRFEVDLKKKNEKIVYITRMDEIPVFKKV